MLTEMNAAGGPDVETAVAAMRALEVELFANHAWSEASVRQELSAPGRTYVFDVADAIDVDREPDADSADAAAVTIGDPARVRGFAGYWYDGEDAEIMDVGVGRAYQRRGIAAAMMAYLIDRARGQGARRMLLEVSVENAPAIALYERLGFERIGLRRRYYQPEGIDAHVMALDLNPRPVGFRSATAGDNDMKETTR
ncbi:GNAT family N-acetyltransferase [Bifidobacterium samirii]|uniref:Ribosomal-protein-alanine acetyl transferase n=1 Tax=Bifidobacterium samirii TaxID=2306974 RepID=A0A430FW22_9BIFI|nr:GNAT family N-acetyltransferase [Bifidobacterium samirii]RSX58181.1 ribosomal- protein-alanine acetyl transferase [Bifidobacterium samirii]